MKFYFNINNINVGYIDYHSINNSSVYIDYICIYQQYRGNTYSTQMFKQFKKYINVNEIHLEAKEDMSKYNKLFNLYKSWNFEPTNITNFYSDSNKTYRKKLFILKNTSKYKNKYSDTMSYSSI